MEIRESRGGHPETGLDIMASDQTGTWDQGAAAEIEGMKGGMGGGSDDSRMTAWILGDGSGQVSFQSCSFMSTLGTRRSRIGKGNQVCTPGGPQFLTLLPNTPQPSSARKYYTCRA